MTAPATADSLDALTTIVGPDHVLVDPDLRAGYEIDWTRRFGGPALAVVRPADTAQVAAIVRWAVEHGVALVPQGGNTGMVGGGVPAASADGRCVVVSLRRLDSIGDPDLVAGQITVGAGVTLANVHGRVAGTGWTFGVDLGARDIATIGGMVATNAGGVRVLRHGSMRHQVLGVEAVLGDGSVVSRLGGLVKDNTGYDLAGLLCGSEGTLGLVTAARLRLVPDPPDRVLVVAALPDVTTALLVAARLRVGVDGIDALEATLDRGADLACDQLGIARPFDPMPPVLLLAEWAGRGAPPDTLVDILDAWPTVAADDARGRAALWGPRERMAEAIARVGIPHKLDVTLPLGRLAEFTTEVDRVVASAFPAARLFLFGHLGDGNLHVNIVGPAPDDERVDDVVLDLVAAMEGSISAEHGVGRAKARHLGLNRSPAELAAFAAIKRALDPAGILNPGVILPVA